MDTSHYDQILLISDDDKTSKKGDEDDDSDEDVVYTASDSLNRSLKMDLKKARSTIITYNKKNKQKNFSLSKSIKDQFINNSTKNENDESNFSKIFKYFLLNLNFLIYGASFCLIINSKQYFIELLNLDFIQITNVIIFGIFSMLIGIIIVSFLASKYDRFYLIFFSSLVASISLILIPFIKSILVFLIVLFLFGFSFGTVKIISYKWCLKKVKNLNNLKLNILYIQILIGLFVCYFLIVSFLPFKSDSNLIQSFNNKTLNETLKYNFKRVFEFNSTLDNLTNSTPFMSTTTTTVIHHFKPEVADGGQLEQNHVTKPNKDSIKPATEPDTTTRKTSELISECILSLNKTCTLSINNCQATNQTYENNLNINNSKVITETLNQCDYQYYYKWDSLTSPNIQSVEEECENVKNLNLNYTNDELNCFNVNKLNRLEDFNKFNSTCKLLKNSNLFLSLCSLYYDCSFDKNEWDNCHAKYLTTISPPTTTSTTTVSTTTTTTTSTTTTTTTPPTTTTTTTTITTTTTSATTTTTTTTITTTTIPITLETTSQSLNEFNYIMDQTFIKLKEFYTSANSLQLFFIILGVLNLLLTSMYLFLVIPYIKTIVLNLISLVCYLIKFCLCLEQCCKDKKTLKKQNSKNSKKFSLKFTKLKNDDFFDDNENETFFMKDKDDDEQSFDDINKSTSRDYDVKSYLKYASFWFYLAILLTYGGLFMNFILFMDNYLISRLSQSYLYQAELINKFFFMTFLIGRLLALILAYFSSTNDLIPSHLRSNNLISNFLNRKIFKNIFNRKHSSLCILFLILFILSFFQLTSDHFTENLKLIFFNKSNEQPKTVQSSPKLTSSFFNVKLDLYTILIFGVLYPFLLSCIIPFLIRLIEDNKKIYFKLKPYKMVNYIWSAFILGSVLISLSSNYFIFTFKTYNVFIYTNIATSFLLNIFLILYSNYLNR